MSFATKITSPIVMERAQRLVARADFLPVPATGAVLAELPRDPFHLWAIGADRDTAEQALCVVVARDLIRKAGACA